jgi:murein DD-endopeptidase MepM/ murein hydrolase activator NlpD
MLGRSYAHTGSDYAVAFSEVYAVDFMDIIATGYNAGNGNYITAYLPTHDHDGYDGGIYIAFIHLSSVNVNVGDRVQPGTKIGVSGNSGANSRGPHLHITMGVNSDQVHLGIGQPLIDPFAYIDARPDVRPPAPTPLPTRKRVIERLKKLISEAKKNLRAERKRAPTPTYAKLPNTVNKSPATKRG